jgi:hypothetical protein
MLLGERGRPSRAPHPDLPKLAHQSQRLKVASRLHPRADDRQHRGGGSGEMIRGDCRDGSGAHLGDEPAVHGHERLAGFGLEEEDRGVVGWYGGVAGVEGYQLRAQGGSGVGRHEAEEPLVLGDGEHRPYRLHHRTAREVG